ncbi:helix-turn-helix domain-containing protein [Nocardia huaxiensis]|uniref:Helix-turn-helix domain-containing protein n=1 Tax=Nocardia huaxiensis TaxID=2755382 RepID=A0A7D6VNN0_9NOCA|nr:helix-turn-helix domain-containing protein [Nocardia huaxiensis]QLY33770.1 helix-turn-helix domain-containing protein [Nocardia huaxiensis]UFS99305.1 helix-turn-helix domain-containing protein [Nocardia huaxiensis]
MSDRLYSVEEVAERLGLHVRTVRGYVRDGKLAAVRIGKQYRIAQADLEAFTGLPVPDSARESTARERFSEVSSIIEIDAIDPATADRITTLLTGAAHNRDPEDQPLRIQTMHDRERARLKVIVVGGVGDTARLLEYVEGVLAS